VTGSTTQLKSPSGAISKLPFGEPQFPAYKPRDGSSAKEFLRQLVLRGLRERYGTRSEQFRPQAMEELGIISDIGYEEYFLSPGTFFRTAAHAASSGSRAAALPTA